VDGQSFPYRAWLRESVKRRGVLRTAAALAQGAFEIVRDSLPSRRRLRYGDLDFDWDYRVDTTWSNIPLRTRIREVFAGRAYQPSDPLTFHQVMSRLPIDFRRFTFVDLGSGKGRALLMASDYPFRRIIGVELLPELHAIAQDNVRHYSSDRQQCHHFELHCADARRFQLPPEPLVIFLFNPFPDDILGEVMTGIERSIREAPRPILVAYQNPVSEKVVAEFSSLRKITGTIAYAIFEVRVNSQPHS
jgi:SAM-dependent methyltransferase